MRASTQYDDLVGTAAADISYGFREQTLNQIAQHFELDQQRFDLIGISLYGVGEMSLSLLCVDKERSTPDNEHLVSMMLEEGVDDVMNLLFERLSIVLHSRHDVKYPNLDFNEEVNFSDFHEDEEEE